jgi:hypothetical protein
VTTSGEQRIRQFRRSLDELKEGQYPLRFACRDAAIEALVNDIVAAPWGTTEERTLAQDLVVRLERLRQ